MVKIRIEDIQFSNDFYPRSNFDNETVNSYRLNIESLPPVMITKEGHYLVDGYHRLLAHKLEGLNEIRVEFLDIPKDKILWEATKLNATHGKQLERSEKQRLAHIFYKNNGYTLHAISDVLAISPSTISIWLKKVIQKMREEQKQYIVELYLQCLTQQEIADKIKYSQRGVSETIRKFKSEISDNLILPESLQLFNVWNFANRDKRYGLDFKGAIPGQIVENVLYYFTKPFDIIVDPMAGSGTTIDVCKVMFRRYRAYDINPIRDDIKKHDITMGFPKECRNCDLIFLDPPYYNMVFDFFQSIKHFERFIDKIAKDCRATVKDKGKIALLMANISESGFKDLAFKSYMYFLHAGFKPINRISVPLTTFQFQGFDVERAREEKRMMGLVRDLIIFQKV